MIAHIANWIVSLPADPDSRPFFGWMVFVLVIASGILIKAVVGKGCALTRWPLINNVPPKSARQAEERVTAIHRDPPKPGTAAHGFTQVRRQQLDAIMQSPRPSNVIEFSRGGVK